MVAGCVATNSVLDDEGVPGPLHARADLPEDGAIIVVAVDESKEHAIRVESHLHATAVIANQGL